MSQTNMEGTTTEKATTEQETTEQDTKTEQGITLNDIVGMGNIINLASRRGAFSAEEFKEIGSIYDKVDKFIKANVKTTEEDEKKTD